MSQSNKAPKIRDLFFNTNYMSKSHNNNNTLFQRNDNTFPKNVFLPMLKSNNNKGNYNSIKNIFFNKDIKNKEMNRISKTFYSIKRQVHYLMPRTQSLIYKRDKKSLNDSGFKNIFHSDTFENIRNKIKNNELNEEFNDKRRKYNLLLFNLIKKNKDSKLGEINIKYDLINKIDKNILKQKNDKFKVNNKKILKMIKQNNYSNFKKDIGETLKRKEKIDKEIRKILDNVEAKFDNIFLDVMDKKYNLNHLNQIRNQDKYISISNSDLGLKF